jgi:pimeloyl-ACP methyl ester carboxylesterase
MATSADGTRIAWYRYGEGPRTVLFVPTWNLVDARVVGHQVVALEPHATVLTYDPRGAGASERPERGYDFSRHAADARAVLDATGTERAVLVTASRGLNVAVLLIADDPQRFDRLASLAPYMKLEPDPPPPDPLEIGLEATPDVIATQEIELDWQRPACLIGQVTCPALVVHGEADAAVPVALAESIVAAMPKARLEVIPGGGHRPDIRSPGLVNPLLLEFLLEPER